MTAPKEVKRTLKGLLLEINLEQQYEVKKACEDQILKKAAYE